MKKLIALAVLFTFQSALQAIDVKDLSNEQLLAELANRVGADAVKAWTNLHCELFDPKSPQAGQKLIASITNSYGAGNDYSIGTYATKDDCQKQKAGLSFLDEFSKSRRIFVCQSAYHDKNKYAVGAAVVTPHSAYAGSTSYPRLVGQGLVDGDNYTTLEVCLASAAAKN